MILQWLKKAGEGRYDDHRTCAQRDEFDKPSLDWFAHKLAADVDVALKFAVPWVVMHSYTRQIVFINFSGSVLLVTKIHEGLTKTKGLLSG